MMDDAQKRFPEINQSSFDKGFHSKGNVRELNERLDNVILPKKGRRDQVEKAWEESDLFGQARRQHSAVEACINNLEIRGLDRCLSHGRAGFERHVALSIVATNVHRIIGLLLQRKALARLRRAEHRKKAA